MTSQKERSAKYDNIKGILIFLVVLGHVLRPLITYSATAKLMYMLIYCFHMPAFIYMLGMFAKPSIKRIGQYMLYYLVFQAIYTPFLHLFYSRNTTWTFLTPQWILWFLLAVVFYTALSFVLPPPDKINKRWKYTLIALAFALAIVIGFIPAIGEPLSLSRIFSNLPFFLMGKYRLFSETAKTPKSRFKWGALAVTVSFVYLFGSKGLYSGLWYSEGYAATGGTCYFRVISLLAAFCWIKFLLITIPNAKLPVITSAGKHTFFIYLAHGFPVKLFHFYFPALLTTASAVLISILLFFALWGSSIAIRELQIKLKKKLV